MTEEIMAVKAILELAHELYSEEQRHQFYKDYQAALNAQQARLDEVAEHSRTDQRTWKFWQRAPADWTAERKKRLNAYYQAEQVVRKYEKGHPLLARIYAFKWHSV